MDNLIGKKIEQFLIETFVGKGKTGSVYQARDLNLDRYVAIKLLSPELAIHPAIRQQVAQAARAVSSLTHPSIVALYNFGHQNGRTYMAMDFVNGMSLGQALERLSSHRQLMPLDETLHIGAQAADALGAAHQEGTLHLNLKPSNILIKRLHRSSRPGESSLRAMLTDFGLALIPQNGIQTAYIDLSGNYPYLAPEQCTNSMVDGRADIYSLGVILYQMLAGRPPFEVRSAAEAIMRHAVEPPLPLRDLRPDVPPLVANIIHTALAKEPVQRYQLAEQMADALRHASRSVTAKEAPATHALSSNREAPLQTASQSSAPVPDNTAVPLQSPPTRIMSPVPERSAHPSAKPHDRGTNGQLPAKGQIAPSPDAPSPDAPSPDAPTPPQSDRIVPRKPVFNSMELAMSETMPVQAQFDTPIFGIAPNVPAKQLSQPDLVPPFVEPFLTPPQVEMKVGTAVPARTTVPPVTITPAQPTPPLPVPVPLPPVVEEPPTDVHVLDVPEKDAQIVIIRQGRGPRQVTLAKSQVLIGRAKDNDIVLNARDVSRYHARLDWVNGRWRVTDLDSSGGTFGDGHRLVLNEPEPWQPEQILQIGPYFLHWAAASDIPVSRVVNDEPHTALFQVPDDSSQIQSTSGRFSVALYPALLTMMAGSQTTVQVELFNQGSNTDTLKMAVSGLPSGTFSLTQHFVTLAPGARANIPLSLHLPATGTLMSYRISAGNYPFEIIIHSKTTESETAVIAGMLIVTTQEQFSLGVWPSQVDDGDNIRILIRNEGNTPNSYSLVGRDEKSLVQFGGQRGRMQLKPGEAVTQVVTVRARQRPLFGREIDIPFEVEVRTENGQQQMKSGQVRVKPQVPQWAVWLSSVIFILLLGALVVTAVVSQNQAQLQTPTPVTQPLSDSENVQQTDAP